MDLMPKKKEINPRAKKLVDILVSKGCTITEASKLAGYKGISSRVSASKMLHKSEVQDYYRSQIQYKVNMSTSKALNSLVRLTDGAKSEYVQLEASKDILDRGGFKAPDKHMHLLSGDFTVKIDLS